LLTRRELLKLGLLSGGYTVLASGSGLRRVFADDVSIPASPRLAAFSDLNPLPIPGIAQEVTPFYSPGYKDFIGSGTRFFEIHEEERTVQVHPGLGRKTSIWGYRDVNVSQSDLVLGPTFKVRMNEGGIVVRMKNDLPTTPAGAPDPLRGFGVPHMTTHLHGGHHPSRSDGFPDNIHIGGVLQRFVTVPPGENGSHFYDYCYPLLDPGSSTGTPDDTERPSTLWYHDHFFDFTGPNVYRGLAGFFLVFDEKDSDDETDQSSTALRLPSGEFDVPLVLQDKRVDANGKLIYSTFGHDGFLGDTFFVNGAVQPFHEVRRRKYRFRFLNGSNARFYRVFLTNSSGQAFPMDQIATEGGLLARPIRGIQSFLIAPAERVEVVVDFTNFSSNTRLYFENRQPQNEGALPGEGVLRRGTQLLELRVTGKKPEYDPSRVGNAKGELRPFAAISAAELRRATRKTFEFDDSDGGWVINDRFANLERALTTSPRNAPQIWSLESGGDWAHPVHIHLEFMRVLRRNEGLPPLNERDGMAKKNTVVIGGPNFGDVEIFVKFRDYPGPFVFHCHNLEHEDMRMMARNDVV